ncbi:hypothetical protein CRG98_050219 [Punica granatum]|uniref:UDP-N-acetylglucosamine transferase subunit ALG14 n=1 Tax=Punica granatum TaxID=22663 RepID=A0A2I0GKN1_PUNGR|nr:hypothetical protein CRG98_050219 [Punica granatum]
MALGMALGVCIIVPVLLLIRVAYVLYRSGKPVGAKSPKSYSTLVVLGSGGHTAEMINLLLVLEKHRFTPRYYIAAATDNMSLQKARSLENSWADKENCSSQRSEGHLKYDPSLE